MSLAHSSASLLDFTIDHSCQCEIRGLWEVYGKLDGCDLLVTKSKSIPEGGLQGVDFIKLSSAWGLILRALEG